MGWLEATIVFVIAWWLSFLPILSAGSTSQQESGEVVPGSEPGAPSRLKLNSKLLIATGIASAITFLFWLSLRFGWLESVFATA